MRLTCLSRKAGRSHADGDGVFGNQITIALLSDGLGLNRLALGGDADTVPGELLNLLLAAGIDQRDAVADILLRQRLSSAEELQQALNHRARLGGVLYVALDFQLTAAAGDFDMQLALNELDIFVKAAEQRDSVFHSVNADNLFRNT